MECKGKRIMCSTSSSKEFFEVWFEDIVRTKCFDFFLELSFYDFKEKWDDSQNITFIF